MIFEREYSPEPDKINGSDIIEDHTRILALYCDGSGDLLGGSRRSGRWLDSIRGKMTCAVVLERGLWKASVVIFVEEGRREIYGLVTVGL